jgi:hypothetical protein
VAGITAPNGESWFLTGDEGYLVPLARLFLAGRNKEMINRGGDKVILSRVDEALLQHSAVEQALAFAIPHPTLGEDLAAAVVLREGVQADERALCRHVSTLLAPYEVPSRILLVQELPRTATGALQRSGIAAKFGELLQPVEEGAQGEMEELVAQAFAAVLQISPPARHANFFLMGGDSLSGARVVNRLSEQLFLEVPTTLLFEYPTVSSVAEQLHELLDQALEEAEQSTS